ncbi:putative nucleotidyltransferase substrate binding domain-containing protein [Uliginosibacterium sp. 31-16]|uniref:putative nucleotidyltransferase substrate binding domain-containing protein n=1 Tax=Uliginosibacterium sp. 31-16 TaxID=3068315 RepID=UPI00273D680F|nr:putative nucleotidyltransferase substrate binding domain-containing protein [Uliginosibacterium sp. 31-16]MDP5239811.1 putative nucleotidyltransferase substrate binding domain-containing protein [Uliginosibacterium sp. 31-16]
MTPFDFSHAPFDCLDPAERQRLAERVDVAYFPKNACLHEANSPVDTLYVVIKGMVSEHNEGETLAYYGPQDSFDSRAMLGGRAQHRLLAVEDTLVFCLPRELVLDLTQRNPVFGAFFYQDVAARFAVLANRPLQGQLQAMLMSRVESAYLSRALWLNAEDSVLDAARLMKKHHATCVLVHTQNGDGIFTRSELRDFVISEASAASTAVGPLARTPLITIAADAYLYHAQLLMAQHTIQRVVVTRDAEVIGILEQVELLSFLSNQSHIVLAQIERAESIVELMAANRSMDELIKLLHGNGVKVTLIADLLCELRRHLLGRAFTLLAPAEMLEHVCLLVLGSEGRGEQILKTDQDNALLIEDGYMHPELQAICERFSQTLLSFGYPPCPGGIMLNQPDWCCELSAMRSRLLGWVRSANAENVMRLAIWADARPVAGKAALLESVQLQSLPELDGAFLSRFALPVMQFDVPLSLFSRLVLDAGAQRDRLDIKKGGIFPLVHGIRSMAVKAGIRTSNTYRRVDELLARQLLPAELAQDLRETLVFLHGLRLQHGLNTLAQGRVPDNLIDPAALSTLERDLLKDALGVVKRFRQLIEHHFQLARIS